MVSVPAGSITRYEGGGAFRVTQTRGAAEPGKHMIIRLM